MNKKRSKYVLIQTASIGDVVLTTPVIEKLAFKIPGVEIDFLVKKGIESLVSTNPQIHHVLVWDKSTGKYGNLFKLIKKIRKKKYDCVVNFHRFFSSGIITMFSGAEVTIGFNKNPLSVFFTRAVKHKISSKPEKSVHEIYRNLRLIERITDHDFKFPVRLYPAREDFKKVSQYKNKKYICIAPTSLWFTKQYPVEKWIEFLNELDDKLQVIFLGSKSDGDFCEKIINRTHHKNCTNLTGLLSFLQSAALMKDALMNYVNDSAPQHFASAMNAPVTTIFCSTVPAFGFGPLSDNSAVVETNEILSCRPCGLHGFKSCPEKHFKCAMSIKKEQLIDRLK